MKMQEYKPLVPQFVRRCPVQPDSQLQEAWFVRGWVVYGNSIAEGRRGSKGRG